MSENALKLSSRIKSENTLARYRGDADVQKLRMDLSKEEYQPIVAAFMTLITTSESVSSNAAPTLELLVSSFKLRNPEWRNMETILRKLMKGDNLTREFEYRAQQVTSLLQAPVGETFKVRTSDLKDAAAGFLQIISELQLAGIDHIEIPGCPMQPVLISASVNSVSSETIPVHLPVPDLSDVGKYDCSEDRKEFVRRFGRQKTLSGALEEFKSFLQGKPVIKSIAAGLSTSKGVTDALRGWVRDSVTPLYNCLYKHYDSSKEGSAEKQFLDRWEGKFVIINSPSFSSVPM
jgi:hypothetical protein